MISTGLMKRSLKGQMIPICVYIVMAVSLNLVVGISGELSLGHAGFMSIGAFSGIIASQSLAHLIPTAPLRLALPVYTPEPAFNRLRATVKRFLRAGHDKWEASDLATLRLLTLLGVTDVTGDWTLYAFNASALASLSALGVRRFVASPENGRDNLAFLAESGFAVECLAQQATPLFISLTEPAAPAEGLAVFRLGRLWVTTKNVPRTFAPPPGAPVRIDLSWNPA